MLVASHARFRAARRKRVGDPLEPVRALPFHQDRHTGVQARFCGGDEILDAPLLRSAFQAFAVEGLLEPWQKDIVTFARNRAAPIEVIERL